MPVFEEGATKTLARVQSIYAGRGVEYADSWSEEFQPPGFVDRMRDIVGSDRSRIANRLVRLAGLVDTKISRIVAGGEYKQDSYDDLIAYLALLADLHGQYASPAPIAGTEAKVY
jgi:hypothetical protein